MSDTNKDTSRVELKEQGRAIARGIVEAQAQKDRNMAKAAKRRDTMFRNAVEDVFKNY